MRGILAVARGQADAARLALDEHAFAGLDEATRQAADTVVDLDAASTVCPACQTTFDPGGGVTRCPECDLNFG